MPILPYYKGEDSELLSLEKYLDLVRKANDVRLLNKTTFKLGEYKYYKYYDELVNELYFKTCY